MAGFFDKMLQTVSATAKTIGEKSSEVAAQGKMKLDIAKLENKINEKKKEIGNTVFESYLANEELDAATIMALCVEIKGYLEDITEMKENMQKGTVKAETVQTMCPTCGCEVAPGAAFCSVCGRSLKVTVEAEATVEEAPAADEEPKRTCKECGSYIEDGFDFCGFCGTNYQED